MTKKIGKLPQTKHIKKQFFLSKTAKQNLRDGRKRLADIISGKSKRKILIIGPCSADYRDSIGEYAEFLAGINKKVSNKIEIVMRFYTGKPRTTVGWKGILHSEPGKSDDLRSGIKYARELAIDIIENHGLLLADELLYPELSSRLWDLYGYMAIGARSSEDQLHREVASGLPFPVGIKNPSSGDLQTMNNGVLAVSKGSHYVMERVIYETPGNISAHGILRGGLQGPNYQAAKDIETPVIVDCNHENSQKKPEKQREIMNEVLSYNNPNIKGFMVESYLYDGRQDYSESLQKGCSLTDPCIGKEETEKFIMEMYKTL